MRYCANIGCGDKIIQSTPTETWDNYDYNHPDQNVIPLDLNNPRFALKMRVFGICYALYNYTKYY